jgi:hypothetical protein
MNDKAVFVLPEWPHVKFITDDLKLLRQIPIFRLLLRKETYLSQVSLPISYWVIDKDIFVKMSFIFGYSLISLVDNGIATGQSDSASY